MTPRSKGMCIRVSSPWGPRHVLEHPTHQRRTRWNEWEGGLFFHVARSFHRLERYGKYELAALGTATTGGCMDGGGVYIAGTAACCLACWRGRVEARRYGHGVRRSDSRTKRLLTQGSCWREDDRQYRERGTSSGVLIGPGNEVPPAACAPRGAADFDIEGPWGGEGRSILGPGGYPQPGRLVWGFGLGVPGQLLRSSGICRLPRVKGSRKARDEWRVVWPGESGPQDAGAKPAFHGLPVAAVLARARRQAGQHVACERTRLYGDQGGDRGREGDGRQDMAGASGRAAGPKSKAPMPKCHIHRRTVFTQLLNASPSGRMKQGSRRRRIPAAFPSVRPTGGDRPWQLPPCHTPTAGRLCVASLVASQGLAQPGSRRGEGGTRGRGTCRAGWRSHSRGLPVLGYPRSGGLMPRHVVADVSQGSDATLRLLMLGVDGLLAWQPFTSRADGVSRAVASGRDNG